MQYEQLEFFELSREEKLEQDMLKLKEQCERTRKSQFAKIGELAKKYDETKHEIETLKSAMCRTDYTKISL